MEKKELDAKLEVTPEEAEKIRSNRFIEAYQALCKEHGMTIGVQNNLIVQKLPEETK